MKSSTRHNSKWSIAAIVALMFAASIATLLAVRSSSDSPSQAGYAVGEVARESVFAPKKITVIDPVATEERRGIELENVPVIFRADPNAANEVVSAFNADFARSRKAFLDAVQKTFGKRKLSTNQVAGPRFREVYTKFKRTNKTFPATIGQALKWAHGNEQEPLQTQFRDALRSASSRYICEENLPLESRGPVRIVPSQFSGTATEALLRSQTIRRTNLVSLSKAQKDLSLSFPEKDRVVSDVLTNYLKVNCVFDEQLTAQVRAEKTKDIWALATFQPGEVIVRKGQIIDARMKAALDEVNHFPSDSNGISKRKVALWTTAFCCAALAFLIGVWMFFFRRHVTAVPAVNVLSLPTNEREQLRAQLAPHLARGLMSRLVRGLISQRTDLIQTQHAGADQLNRLEQRLEQINARLEKRQLIYEQRIAEVEKELAAAEEENREMIRAKLHEARQNLEWVKAQNS